MSPRGKSRRSRICESGGEERVRGWVNTWEVRVSDSPNWVRDAHRLKRLNNPARQDFPDSPPDMARLNFLGPKEKKKDLWKIAREKLHCWGKTTWVTAGLSSEHGSQKEGARFQVLKGEEIVKQFYSHQRYPSEWRQSILKVKEN